MAFANDILEGMQDVPAQAAPGDLSTLSCLAARLAKSSDQQHSTSRQDTKEQDTKGQATKHDFLRAKACMPCSLSFVVPANCRAGHPVCLQGPHGVLWHRVPQGCQAGDSCSIRLGPPNLEQIVVPQGSQPGDVVKFEGPDGEELEARIPVGLQAGDVFDATAPVVMLQVPEGAETGDWVMFSVPAGANVPDTSDRQTRIPKGMKAGQYFSAHL